MSSQAVAGLLTELAAVRDNPCNATRSSIAYGTLLIMALRTGPAVDELPWLQRWFASRCDGNWEHDCGVNIESCDNPGWWVKADVNKEPPDRAADRVLLVTGEPPRAENGNVGGADWMRCEVARGKFDGAGDPTKLAVIIRCFREMVAGPV